MAVIKEYGCKKCGPFEAVAAVCPRCGKTDMVTRQFRTAPGINRGATVRGSAKGIDRIIEKEFDRRGIVNYTNKGGMGKPEFRQYNARVREQFPGVYASQMGGAQTPPIQAQFMGDFASTQSKLQGMTVDGKPFQMPEDSAGTFVRPGARVGTGVPPPADVVARTDSKGRQIPVK